MHIVSAQNLACPLDNHPLSEKSNNQLHCPSGHSFDIARQGYINLLPIQDKRSKDPGDTKPMIDARTRLLDSGIYGSLSSQLNHLVLKAACATPKKEIFHILDAGCGEGYYLQQLFTAATAINNTKRCALTGMDISKAAIIAATRRNRQDISWIVGTNRKPPLLPNTVNCILSIFGFPVYDIFKQLLAPSGIIILAEAGPDHLIELREIIYDKVHKAGPPALLAAEQLNFQVIDEQIITVKTPALSSSQIKDLLLMTPHFFRIKAERLISVENISSLEMTVNVIFRTLSLT